MEIKNQITLKCNNEIITLYDFKKVDIYVSESAKTYNVYYRIECDGKFYYYPFSLTTIQSIEIY